MCDGVEPAQAPAANPDGTESGLDACEQAMFIRMSRADEETAEHLEETFGDAVPDSLLAPVPGRWEDR